MDKLELGYQGGDPLTLDDLEFMQNALMDGIKGLASVWQFGGLDPIIISGIVGTVSGLNTTWTSGYIVVNSEVYYVPAATTVTIGTCIDISETIDTNGDETFENLIVNSTYKVRRGVLKNMVGGPNEIDIADFISLMDRLVSLGCVKNQAVGWVNVPSFSSSWGNGGSITTGVCRYRKNQIGSVELCGGAKIATSTGATEIVFTLPVGYRPIEQKVFNCIGRDGANYNALLRIVITTSGSVVVSGHTSGNTVEVYLHSINFTLD